MFEKKFVRPLIYLVVVLSLSATATRGANILFISSMDPAHMVGDDALKAFIEGLGHTVTYLDDNEDEATTEAAAAAADMVFISESCGSGNIKNEITELEVPMIVGEPYAWDEMGLTEGGGGDNPTVTTNVEIVNPGHYLAAGLSGTVAVLTDITSALGGCNLGKGIVGPEATVIATATLSDGQTYAVIFVYEKGAALPVAPADGSAQVAADIRIGFGFHLYCDPVLNENAYALLEAAINYALGQTEEPPSAGIPIAVPNGDFEDYASVGDGITNAGWGSFPSAANGLVADAIPIDNDEFYTNPSTFGSSWQSNGPAGLNGKYGLQHPRKDTYFDMNEPFSGDFIGFVNLDDGDGFAQSIQSDVIGTLEEGTYTLTVAVGARPRSGADWNDARYEISLVANPVIGAPDNAGPALGSRDGTILGTPASVVLSPATAAVGSNNQDLVYVLEVGADNPDLGAPFAIRIDVYNTLEQNGVPDEGNGGTNYRFTQGNFDNVRLALEPTPVDPGTEGLVGQYLFDDGTANDSSGNTTYTACSMEPQRS